ncbi:MAG: glycosyltransferase [candidate division Zixibacteria bacterium]|nr:glycosyltransferase [candidate division Zixibacteria bacterium]MDH3936033.1 glycosyltransferase [candidate division Zixibacteria bacterium]MDH4033817.1 glycosyltransferase [candidate division Zixibacteria bacterium]
MSFVSRTKFRLKDFARFNPTCRLIASTIIEWRDRMSPPHEAVGIARSVINLAKAARICPSPGRLRRLESKLRQRIDRMDPSQLEWDQIFPHSSPRQIRKGVILKRPVSDREKGVLFIAFEDHWLRLLRYADLKALHRKYHLVLAPTWSPPHDLPMTLAAKMWPGTLFNIMSAVVDHEAFARLADNLVSIPLISSNWVNPDVFAGDDDVPKEFDIVMLANFAVYKRHWLMFDVLSRLPPTTKLLLLGRGWEGRSAETIMAEARAFGSEDKVIMKEGLSDADMVRAIKSAKVSLIFSGNEGACVAVVEAMFSGVPVGLFADAIIGSKAYVNEQTGCLFTRSNVVRKLSEFIQNYRQYQPRKWVLENGVSYVESTRILNEAIRSAALDMGEQWTLDIHEHQWRPNPTYLSDDICREMRPHYDSFESAFGIPLITAGVNDDDPAPNKV